MSDAKLHHYVPQTYLRSFADSQDRIWAYNKASQKSFPTVIKNVGSETQFYSSDNLEEIFGDRLLLEKKLCVEEGKFAEILRQILCGIGGRGKWRLKKPQRYFLSRYIALQFMRTREHRNKQREMIENTGSTIKSWCERRGMIVPVDVLEALKDPEAQAADLQQDLLMSDGVIQGHARILFSHIWLFFQPPKGSRFMTSDHPVVLHGHVNRHHRGIGLRTFGVEICFPLTPTLLVSLREREAFHDLADLDGTVRRYDCDENVVWANNLQICKSTRMVFSDVNDFSLVEEVLADHPVVGDVTRRRLRSNHDICP